MDKFEKVWGPVTKHDGPSALDKINVRHAIAHIKREIEQRLEEQVEATKRPVTRRGFAIIKRDVLYTKEQYAKLPGVTVEGGIIDRYTITRVQNDRRWVIRATMMYDDGTEAFDAEFSSRRKAGAWARQIIRLIFIDIDLTVQAVMPVERIDISGVVVKEVMDADI